MFILIFRVTDVQNIKGKEESQIRSFRENLTFPVIPIVVVFDWLMLTPAIFKSFLNGLIFAETDLTHFPFIRQLSSWGRSCKCCRKPKKSRVSLINRSGCLRTLARTSEWCVDRSNERMNSENNFTDS